ncbi:MAG: TetR/AcrR family transcriptional regulator [Cocleimonas sp.]|nr:TetR/AcrR family transcriptional regulator [Cocleimonas sp.]
MPYSKEHKKETRKKILDSAITLFSSKGFDQVSIDELMQHADLTRGAFYAHFESKEAVYAKAIIAGAKKSRITHQKPKKLTEDEWMKDLLMGYLSEDHITQKYSPCPLAFLVTDIANNKKEVRATYTRIYKILNKTIQIQLDKNPERPKPNEQEVFATTAMMIGGVAIGRALNDEATIKDLLDSCRKATLSLLKLEN